MCLRKIKNKETINIAAVKVCPGGIPADQKLELNLSESKHLW